MTQDEVDLIYDYLHENYEYRDGELIRKIASNGWKKGHILGTYLHGARDNDCLISCLSIRNKKYNSTVAHWIYLYHYKEKPSFIRFKDGNKMNARIENLISSDAKKCSYRKFINSKGYTIKQKGERILYEVKITLNYKTLYLGSYSKEDEAIQVYAFAKTFIQDGIEDVESIKSKILEILPFFHIHDSSNKTGYPGVSKARSKFIGRIRVGNKRICTKAFSTPQKAHEALLKAKAELTQ